MSEAMGQVVFLDGYCGRIEAQQGSTVFLRIDEWSEPERLTEARMHFQGRHEGDEVFPGEKLWPTASRCGWRRSSGIRGCVLCG